MLTTLLLYCAGHLVILVIALIFVRMLRREPNFVARRQAIFELNSKPVRIEAGEAELAASRAELKEVDRRTNDVERRINECVPLDDPPSTKLTYAFVGAILGEAEAFVVWLLSGPVAFLSLSSTAWAFAAPPFAAAWIILLHVLIGSLVADKHRPARTVRRAKVGAGLCGAAVIIGAWLTLSGRNLSDTATIEQLAGVGLMILAALLSLCAAFCSIVATTLAEAQHYEKEIGRLQRLWNSFTRHIELIEKDLFRLKTPPEHPDGTSVESQTDDTPNGTPAVNAQSPAPGARATDPTAPRPNGASGIQVAQQTSRSQVTADSAVPNGILPTMLALCMLIALPHLTEAQTSAKAYSINTEAPSRASVPSFARDGACEFVVDVTSSVGRTALLVTLDQVSGLLPLIVDALHCTHVRLTPFAGDLFVSIDEISVPSVDEDPVGICKNALPSTTSAKGKAIGLLYPQVAKDDVQKAVDSCVNQRRKAQERELGRRRAAVGQVGERLRTLANIAPRGPCTALPQAVQRALVRSQHVVSITDGITTCTPPPTMEKVPADGHLLFLLVPTNGPGAIDNANALLDRLGVLEKSFAGSRALLAPEATPAFWLRLGDAKPTLDPLLVKKITGRTVLP